MKWISVKDQMPESRENILAFVNNPWNDRGYSYSYEGMRLVKQSIYIKEKNIFETDCCGRTLGNVTHWMELPEKPNEMD